MFRGPSIEMLCVRSLLRSRRSTIRHQALERMDMHQPVLESLGLERRKGNLSIPIESAVVTPESDGEKVPSVCKRVDIG